MKSLLSLCTAAVAFMATAALGASLKPDGTPRVFSGQSTARVIIVPLLPSSKNEALIKVEGSGHDFDGHVFLAHREQADRRAEYYVPWEQGKKAIVFSTDERNWGSGAVIHTELHGVRVSLDKKATAAQKDSNALISMFSYLPTEKFKDATEQKKHVEKTVAVAKAEAEKACGAKIAFELNYSSFGSDAFRAFDVSRACSAPFEGLESVCESPEGKTAVRSQIKKVVCKAGAFAPTRSGTTLTWTTNADKPNQDLEARWYLLDHLD